MLSVRACLLLSLMLVLPSLSHAAQRVLVSVHPLALLVKSAWPQLEVSSLVPSNQSPHDFSLKPSDIRRVNEAAMVVWLGPEIEPYLVRLMAQKSAQLALGQLPEPQQAGDHGHEHEHDHHDPHLWLQPDIIIPLLARLQKTMKLAAPIAFLEEYEGWLMSSQQAFDGLRDRGFISYHDAFQPWVQHFNLKQLDVVTNNPEKPVGTRHVVQVRQILASGAAACIFVEPQFRGRLLEKLTRGLAVKRIKIDPLASSYEVKDANFMSFYRQLSRQFKLCLSQ